MVDTLTVAGQTVSAGFNFAQDANGLELTLSNMSVSLGGVVSLTNGGGMLLVKASGVSGSASGTLASSFPGFSFSGALSATFAPGVIQLSGTGDMLTAGDQTLTGDFNFIHDNTGLHLTASNFSASFVGGLIAINNASGSLDIVSGALTGGFTGNISIGSSLTGVSFAGAITVNVSSTGITASTPSGQLDTLTVLGQSLSAAFNFSEDANGLELAISGLNLSFGNGAIGVTNASGTVLVSESGISGTIEGGLSGNIPGVSFNSTDFDIAFGNGALVDQRAGREPDGLQPADQRQLHVLAGREQCRPARRQPEPVDRRHRERDGGRRRFYASPRHRRRDERVGLGQCLDQRAFRQHSVQRQLQRRGQQRFGQRQRHRRYAWRSSASRSAATSASPNPAAMSTCTSAA